MRKTRGRIPLKICSNILARLTVRCMYFIISYVLNGKVLWHIEKKVVWWNRRSYRKLGLTFIDIIIRSTISASTMPPHTTLESCIFFSYMKHIQSILVGVYISSQFIMLHYTWYVVTSSSSSSSFMEQERENGEHNSKQMEKTGDAYQKNGTEGSKLTDWERSGKVDV